MATNKKPLLSIITPAYNESAIIINSLERLCHYLASLESRFRWELIVVNDGSKDQTGELAEAFAMSRPNIKVTHHPVNLNLGRALQTGFKMAKGDYVVVMDLDLTYSEDHIERLLDRLIAEKADMVIASPYMKGGKNTAVPRFRLLLSKTVNRIMRISSGANIYTFTGMVRAYRKSFLDSLNLKSGTYSINAEIIHKAIILRARILEIPAHLDWSGQENVGRTSSIRVLKGIFLGLMQGFIFRPYVLFLGIGAFLLLVSLYMISWIFIHTFAAFPEVATEIVGLESKFGEAIGIVYRDRPHAFIVGGVSFIVALQFLGIGLLSLQAKRYFDELFHINTGLRKGQLSNLPNMSNGLHTKRPQSVQNV